MCYCWSAIMGQNNAMVCDSDKLRLYSPNLGEVTAYWSIFLVWIILLFVFLWYDEKQIWKKTRAAGPAGIPSEMLTALGEFGIKEITNLLNIIHDTGEIPTDFKKSVKIAIPTKKTGTFECEQHRTIRLMSHFTNVTLRVFQKRMRNKILPKMSESQFGFMADEGSRNDIFSLRTFMERAIKVQNELYLCFIDYLRHLWK